jgi:hypothetical protein
MEWILIIVGFLCLALCMCAPLFKEANNQINKESEVGHGKDGNFEGESL